MQMEALEFLDLKEEILSAVDDLPVSVNVLDFDNCPEWFISEVDNNFKFVCGNKVAFQQLLGKVYGIKKALSDS